MTINCRHLFCSGCSPLMRSAINRQNPHPPVSS
ncbi:hypothetical protein GU930_10735 [Pantoea vagans]|nr:hypothetical protein [Pantoea vagans]